MAESPADVIAGPASGFQLHRLKRGDSWTRYPQGCPARESSTGLSSAGRTRKRGDRGRRKALRSARRSLTVDSPRLEVDWRQRSVSFFRSDDGRLAMEEAPSLAEVRKLSAADVLILQVQVMECSLHTLGLQPSRREVEQASCREKRPVFPRIFPRTPRTNRSIFTTVRHNCTAVDSQHVCNLPRSTVTCDFGAARRERPRRKSTRRTLRVGPSD